MSSISEQPDWSKYPAGLWGYAGMNLNEVAYWTRSHAVRTRIGGRGLYKPGFTQLPNGDLLAGPCYRAEDGRWCIDMFRSTDEGRSWTQVETKGDELLGKEPALITLGDGGVLNVTSHPHGFRVSKSNDDGVTWRMTAIGEVYEDATFGPGYEMVRNVLEDSDGSLTLLMSKGTCYDPDAPPSRSWLFRSSDGGRTWAEHTEVKVWDRPESMFGEASLTRLHDGRILAAGRVSGDVLIDDIQPPRGTPTPSGDESGDHMILSESADGGITWSEPRPFLNYAVVHAHLLALADGRLLCSYATYHLPFGIFAVLSDDNGETWDTEHPIQLAMSLDMYTGWPTSIQLPDGDILTAYTITGYLEHPNNDEKTKDAAAESVRWKLPLPIN